MATTRPTPATVAEKPPTLDYDGATPRVPDMSALDISGPSMSRSASSAQVRGEVDPPTPSGHEPEDTQTADSFTRFGNVGEEEEEEDARIRRRLEKGKAPEVIIRGINHDFLSAPTRKLDVIEGSTQNPLNSTSGESSSTGAPTDAIPELLSTSCAQKGTQGENTLVDTSAPIKDGEEDDITLSKEKGKQKENPASEPDSPSKSSGQDNSDSNDGEDFDYSDNEYDDIFGGDGDDISKTKSNPTSTPSSSSSSDPTVENKVEGPPPKLTIRFRDAVGRNFLIPWEKARTWTGMKRVIQSSFSYMYTLGPQVLSGHYDLFVSLPISMEASAAEAGSSSSSSSTTTTTTTSFIVIPDLWAETIEPGMLVTMSMRPPGIAMPPPPPPPAMAGRGRGRGRGGGMPGMFPGPGPGPGPGPAGRGGGGGFFGPPMPPPHNMFPPNMGMGGAHVINASRKSNRNTSGARTRRRTHGPSR
ncbi:hypothetical protein GGS20DRAFT_539158 [Poronia punctata]|nr:hypothetical protein GGS20DRAFT_539158 [Poronia punctata]